MSGSIDITPLTIAHNKKVLMMHCIHDKLPGKNMQNILCTKCTVLSENWDKMVQYGAILRSV